jgi:hypothetical protein
MNDELVTAVAKAIYNTHWRRPTPHWDTASRDVKEWVRKQAVSAIRAETQYRLEYPDEPHDLDE